MKPVNCNRRFSLPATLLIICMVAGGCVPAANSSAQTELMVFAAMSLRKPLTEIAQLYESQHPGIKVNVNYAGSSSLATQIISGAPSDVFSAASKADMDTLVQRGLVDEGTIRIFACNSVVLVTSVENSHKFSGFNALTSNAVKRIAVGNAKLTPAGRYAEEVLDYYGIREQIVDKLILCDTVAQICDYTVRGEVDAGIVFYTDYLSRQDQLALVEEAPAVSHRVVEYPVGVVRQSRNQVHARQFIELLCARQGTAILSAYGFRQLLETSR